MVIAIDSEAELRENILNDVEHLLQERNRMLMCGQSCVSYPIDKINHELFDYYSIGREMGIGDDIIELFEVYRRLICPRLILHYLIR